MNRNIFTFIQNIHDYRKIPNSIIHRRMKNDWKFNNRDELRRIDAFDELPLSFLFPFQIRPPRGAIYEFTPQMRIMALIRDIWLEHCRGSPHACPRTTLCTVVSHRWCNRNPYIHICVPTSASRPLFSDSPIVNRFPTPYFFLQPVSPRPTRYNNAREINNLSNVTRFNSRIRK